MPPSASSRKKLTLNTDDFWKFYTYNQNFIDRIILSKARRYASDLDPRDIQQDVLIKLHDSNVLKMFNPAKSQLNTYLTMKIMGHVRHAEETHTKMKQRRVLQPELNATDEDGRCDRDAFFEIERSQAEQDEAERDCREALCLVRRTCPDDLNEVIDKIAGGKTVPEIAAEKGAKGCNSSAMLHFRLNKVLDRLKKILGRKRQPQLSGR